MDISLLTDSCMVTNPLFFSSCGSTELSLLLALSFVRRLKPSVPLLDKSRLTLASILMHYLEMKNVDSSEIIDEDVVLVNRFKSQPQEVKNCILNGIQCYSKLFCVSDTWFILLRKSNCKHIAFEPPRRSILPPPSPTPDTIFSTSFPAFRFCRDLKQTKRLLSAIDGDSLYSSLC